MFLVTQGFFVIFNDFTKIRIMKCLNYFIINTSFFLNLMLFNSALNLPSLTKRELNIDLMCFGIVIFKI